MRQITVTAPHNTAGDVAKVAFAVGISQVTVAEKLLFSASGSTTTVDSIQMEVGTPLAKAFVDEFTSKPFFNREKYAIAVRQPLSNPSVATLPGPTAKYRDHSPGVASHLCADWH